MHEPDRSIPRLMQDALRQRRRAQIAQRFLRGEWGVELESFEADQEREQPLPAEPMTTGTVR